MLFSFKKEFREGLFTYLHVDNASYGSMAGLENKMISYPDKKAIEPTLYKNVFHYYIALSEFCCAQLSKYLFIKSRPFLKEQLYMKIIGTSKWNYKFLSDDTLGLGIDEGFIQEQNLRSYNTNQALAICSIDSFLNLQNLSEDVFGEAISQCSFLGLKQDRETVLNSFMQSAIIPHLNELIQEKEIFFHFVVAKEVGYYNTFLIKSKTDIEDTLNAFQNILDPSN